MNNRNKKEWMKERSNSVNSSHNLRLEILTNAHTHNLIYTN